MNNQVTRILLVQDNPDYVTFLKDRLNKELNAIYEIRSASTLKGAVDFLATGKVDIILLELSLPDSRGLDTFDRIQAVGSTTPIVVLTSLDDEIVALHAVQKGAQDYLLKGEVEGKLLPRVIRYAIERHRLRAELINLSFADDLTNLHNRRGFFVFSDQQIKMARRSKRGFLMILADVDGLKQINDTYGHPQGDIALTKAAELIRKTFRKSDILARIGGDEFAILAIEAGRESLETITRRLETNFDAYNAEKNHEYKLSLSVGAVYFDPEKPLLVEQLVMAADEVLYSNKKNRKSSRVLQS